MLPRPGVTGKEPFASGTLDQKKEWLGRLYKIMQRSRTRIRIRTGTNEVDDKLAAAGLPDALTGPFTPTDDEVNGGTAQRRLEAIGSVLQTFPLTLSPVDSVRPSQEQATVLASLFGEVEACYQQIAEGEADQHIKDIFSAGNLRQVRGIFNDAAKTAQNVKNFLKNGNPPPDWKKFQIVLDVSGELRMKSVGALSAPWEMILPPYLATPAEIPQRAKYIDTLLHECMHVLSVDIVDHTYWPDPNFATYSFDTKIHNADHFAEVARRYRGTNTPLPGAGADIYARINNKELISGALGQARGWAKAAWLYGLDAWNVLRIIKDDPNYYDRIGYLQRWSLPTNMNLISQISKATLHERGLAPGARLKSVTEFDLALLEEAIVDLGPLYGWLRDRAEIQIVRQYPAIPQTGVLYVRFEDLAADVDALAKSFLEYGFSHLDQTEPWLQTNTVIANITSMVTHESGFRGLPGKL